MWSSSAAIVALGSWKTVVNGRRWRPPGGSRVPQIAIEGADDPLDFGVPYLILGKFGAIGRFWRYFEDFEASPKPNLAPGSRQVHHLGQPQAEADQTHLAHGGKPHARAEGPCLEMGHSTLNMAILI